MGGLAKYVLAGVIGALAMNFAAPSDPDASVGAVTVAQPGMQIQWVDRSGKGDRLDIDTSIVHEHVIKREPAKIMEGCEPTISPLAASARAENTPRRCVAALNGGLALT